MNPRAYMRKAIAFVEAGNWYVADLFMRRAYEEDEEDEESRDEPETIDIETSTRTPDKVQAT